MLPDYWMERPPLSLDGGTQSAIQEYLSLVQPQTLLDVNAILRAAGNVTPWQFLCGLADRREIAFHGTGDPNIESFEPREPIDFAPFGQQKAVFATSDPIWAMFYAIVDRDRYQLTLNNGCILLMDGDGLEAPYYYFSITRSALHRQPWRSGYVYFLPPESFVEQPAGTYAGHSARIPQLASPIAVKPFARLQVAPDDFPFLTEIRGHEDDRLAEYAQAVMAAAPWPD
jgi:hypothetical protein